MRTLNQQSKLNISQLILVEGKYDKIKLESFINGTILTTDGFRIFKDSQKRALIRALSEKNGLILLTDSDVAGFKIRNFIKSIAPNASITHLYIPPIKGKEKRKTTPSKEGTIGVEGIDTEYLKKLFVQYANSSLSSSDDRQITKHDFYKDGLCGAKNSSLKRGLLLQELNLPSYLSSNALLQVVNHFMTYDEYCKWVQTLVE